MLASLFRLAGRIGCASCVSRLARRGRRGRWPTVLRAEPLETRHLLSAPSLASIPNVILYAGAPLHIALDGFDADGDALAYTATSSNSAFSAVVSSQTNRSLRFTIQGFGTGGTDGVMEFHLFEDLVPRTTQRIIELTQTPRSGQPLDTGFYDGLKFHRVSNGFIIQGGDPEGNGMGGSGVDFDDEFNTSLLHTSSGILSMAKGSDDSNDSQFFITGVPTRHLDFNHTIFGFLTKGEEVREAIENTAVTGSTPTTDVVMKSVRVFTDTENGVLRLSAPHGASDTSDVTVTVSDGHGGTASQTFQVNVLPDDDGGWGNAYPYLLPIQPIRTGINTPAQFTIPAQDVEGDAIYYAAQVESEGKLTLEVNSTTGVATVTPVAGTAPGVYAVSVYTRPVDPKGYFSGRDVWDTQAVPVLVHPAAPTDVELLASSDTGLSTTDRITNRNNTAGNTLSFRVSGVLDGAEVRLYANGQLIGQGTASGDSAVVITDGTTALTDGVQTITAVQVLCNQPVDVGNLHTTVDLDSAASAPLEITVETSVPQFNSVPVEMAVQGTEYRYDVETIEEGTEPLEYQLVQSPAGMAIDPATGVILWTPLAADEANQLVRVRAGDLAGNFVEQTFTVRFPDPVVLLPADLDCCHVTVHQSREDLVVTCAETQQALLRQPLALTQSLTLEGADDRVDWVAVNFTGGNIELPGGIHFQGGNGAVPDQLVVRGTAAADTFELGNDLLTANGLEIRPDGVERLTLRGQEGDDRYRLPASPAQVLVVDTDGIDDLDLSGAAAGVKINLSRQRSQAQWIQPWQTTLSIEGRIENLVGTAFADRIVGNAADNRIRAGGGNDLIWGGAGQDLLWGDAGADAIYGETGDDVLVGGSGPDLLVAGDGRDILIGGMSKDSLDGEAGEDVVIGGATDHDENQTALLGLLAEWRSPNSISRRIQLLSRGGGLNESFALRRNVTVRDDYARDVLFGGQDSDWFLYYATDTLGDRTWGDR